MEKYRPLQDGEILQIGDEYFSQGQWVRLEEEEYRDWISCATTYQPEEMCPFRRLLNPSPSDEIMSKEILDDQMFEVNESLFSTLGLVREKR